MSTLSRIMAAQTTRQIAVFFPITFERIEQLGSNFAHFPIFTIE